MPSEGVFSNNQPCEYFMERTGFLTRQRYRKAYNIIIFFIFDGKQHCKDIWFRAAYIVSNYTCENLCHQKNHHNHFLFDSSDNKVHPDHTNDMGLVFHYRNSSSFDQHVPDLQFLFEFTNLKTFLNSKSRGEQFLWH